MVYRFKFLPLDSSRAGDDIAHLVDIIDQSGLNYQLTAEGTLLEGPPEKIFSVVQQCLAYARKELELERFHFSLTGDEHGGQEGELAGAVLSMEKRLGRELHTTPAPLQLDDHTVATAMEQRGRRQAQRERELCWKAASTAVLLAGLGGALWWMGRKGKNK